MTQPFQEPLRKTITRTVAIAMGVGAVLAWRWSEPASWPVVTLLLLWPSFGGHWVDLFFLNYLRPRLPVERFLQIAVRVAVWFAGGIVLALGMKVTAAALSRNTAHWPAWWVGGLAFIGLELAVHMVLQLRGLASFYNGRG